jgi:hypothetical protein
MAALKGGDIISSATPSNRIDLDICVIQQEILVEMAGDDQNLFPMERLDLVNDIPPMVMIHGKNVSTAAYRIGCGVR